MEGVGDRRPPPSTVGAVFIALEIGPVRSGKPPKTIVVIRKGITRNVSYFVPAFFYVVPDFRRR